MKKKFTGKHQSNDKVTDDLVTIEPETQDAITNAKKFPLVSAVSLKTLFLFHFCFGFLKNYFSEQCLVFIDSNAIQ